MLFKKIFCLLMTVLLFGQSLAQVANADKKDKTDISPELREKSVKLLNNLVGEAEQFTLPKNRVTARITIADLLWEHDEKQARAMFSAAVSELNTLIGQIPPADAENPEEYDAERYWAIYTAQNLRSQLLTTLAARDPQMAMDAMQTLNASQPEDQTIFEEEKSFEITLAAAIAKKDPKQAYEVAKKNLESGLSYNLFSMLEEIYAKDTEIGAKLANDIYNKLTSSDTKIGLSYEGNTALSNTNAAMTGDCQGCTISNTNKTIMNVSGNFMTSVVVSSGITVQTWDVQSFIDTIKKLNRQAARNKKSPVLGESEIKEIITILAKKYLEQEYLTPYEVSKVMPEITKYVPAQAQAIRRKLGAQSTELNTLVKTQTFQNETEGKTADEILQLITRKPAAERDDLYWQAAENAFNAGNVEDAKKFYANMKTRREYDYLDERIAADLPTALAAKGDMKAVRELIGKMKTPEEKIKVLTELAATVGKNGDKKAAKALIEEARSLYSGRMRHKKNLNTILDLATAYAVVEPELAFALLEANMPFVNDVIGAAILLDEYNETGATESDEAVLKNVSDASYNNVPRGVKLLKTLAEADFDRTVSLAERFSRPEIRFFARYRIVQTLLDPNAEKLEKETQKTLQEQEHEH